MKATTMVGIIGLGIILIILLASGLVIFNTNTNKSDIVIGAVLPLTGGASFWGESAQKGIQLAVQDVNKDGGIKGRNIKVIFEDSACDPSKSVSAFKKLTEFDEVDAVIGDICSSGTLAIAPIAEEQKKILITPCSEASAISEAGDFIFRTWVPNGAQGDALARHAYKQGIRKIALLSVNNDLGESIGTAVQKTFTSLGGQVVFWEKYALETTDFRTLLQKARDKKVDAFFIAGLEPDSILLVRQIREANLDVQIFAGSTINTPNFFTALGARADGIIFADIEDITTPAFRARWKQEFNQEWPGATSCASVAYDDVSILTDAITSVGTDSEKIKKHFYTLKDFKGVSGPITFDSNGDLVRENHVYQIESGKPVAVKS